MKRVARSEIKTIKEKQKLGWSGQKIAKYVGVSYYSLKKFLDEQKAIEREQKVLEEEKQTVPYMSRSLERHNTFGKFCEETQDFIKALYRETITPNIVADFLGLNYSAKKEHTDTGGFYEKDTITFKDECKQAQAEAKIKLIIAATTDPKPNDALRFLTADASTRDIYKAPKEEKEAIKIEFQGFNRDSTAPNFPSLDDDKPEKLN